MENQSKPVKFGTLAEQIVRDPQARRSKATGLPQSLKVIAGNPSPNPPANPSMREERFRDRTSNTTRPRKINQAR